MSVELAARIEALVDATWPDVTDDVAGVISLLDEAGGDADLEPEEDAWLNPVEKILILDRCLCCGHEETYYEASSPAHC